MRRTDLFCDFGRIGLEKLPGKGTEIAKNNIILTQKPAFPMASPFLSKPFPILFLGF